MKDNDKNAECRYCGSGAHAFMRTPTVIMGNGAERFLLVGLGDDGLLHVERKTVRKRTMDIDFLGSCSINYCPMCGAKIDGGKDDDTN